MNGAELVAIHKGRYFSRSDGLALGPGPFVVALEYATGKTATVIGKPQKSFFLSALEGLDCQPHETVMIGDVCTLLNNVFYDCLTFRMPIHKLLSLLLLLQLMFHLHFVECFTHLCLHRMYETM